METLAELRAREEERGSGNGCTTRSTRWRGSGPKTAMRLLSG
jgi:hypothetical protein